FQKIVNTVSMTLDQQRWAALKAGQKTALAQIYEQEVEALYSYGRQFTPDAALVEDCIQELFISLWQNRSTLGATTAIRPYLLVSLRRRIVRKLEQQGRRFASDEISESQMGSDSAVENQIIQGEEANSRQATLQAALQRLSDRQREVLYLKYFEGYNYKEIAELIGLNHQSVRNTATRALQALRKIMPLFLWWIFFIQVSTLGICLALYH
ncbi:MAG: sigma-70 family RNA polymerase sigma factor, partial [Bacteroidota bacterium]